MHGTLDGSAHPGRAPRLDTLTCEHWLGCASPPVDRSDRVGGRRRKGRSTPERLLVALEFGLPAPRCLLYMYADFGVRGSRLCGVTGIHWSSSQGDGTDERSTCKRCLFR